MSDMKEFWGMMNVLDNADDVALFVVSGRDGKILYCNHLVTVLTNAHAGSHVSQVWDMEDYQKANTRCNEGGTYRYMVAESPFGKRRNVTVSKVVWSQGILAYSFLLTAHVDDKEEEERDRIFGILGRDFRHIFLMDMLKGEVTTLLKPKEDGGEGHYRAVYYHPVRFDEWKKNLITEHAHPDDMEQLSALLEPVQVREKLEKGDYSFQYRRRVNGNYRWTELRFRKLSELDGRVVCTERDAQGETHLNRREKENEVILSSISNIYRSIYLLDLPGNSFVTVKPDPLLFGIPGEGSYETLLQIVSEFIPDKGQKKDFSAMFSTKSLGEAFAGDAENVVREYKSAISEGESWMSVSAFRPPYMQGMEDKCVLTFMDITEHKRVEEERNEKNIIIDILSTHYKAVYFVDLQTGAFHSYRIAPEYRYIEKQYPDADEAMNHYARAYVLEQYRETFQNSINLDELRAHVDDELRLKELTYRTVADEWVRLQIYPLSEKNGVRSGALLLFEDYTDVMEQREMSLMYNAALLADYDYMFEYDADDDMMYELSFDGERLIREKRMEFGLHSEEFSEKVPLHPDDRPLFMMAFSPENLDETYAAGKTVSHMFLRRMTPEGYRLFMYGFHFYEDMGKRRVLIMARDSEREVL